ncbi:hypothetical protein ACYOEI_34250, partial [Singulisphaera rosea]
MNSATRSAWAFFTASSPFAGDLPLAFESKSSGVRKSLGGIASSCLGRSATGGVAGVRAAADVEKLHLPMPADDRLR